jgi:hypothetical protein
MSLQEWAELHNEHPAEDAFYEQSLEVVKCAGCGCILAKDDADCREFNEDAGVEYVCPSCSAALDDLQRLCR